MSNPIVISDATRTLGNVVLNHESMLIEDNSSDTMKSLWGLGGTIDVHDSNLTITGPALTSDTIDLTNGSYLAVGQGESLAFLAPVTLDGTGSNVELLGAALAKAAAGYTYDASTGKLDMFSAGGLLLAYITVHIPTAGYSLLVF
jgi:hypothetical protein